MAYIITNADRYADEIRRNEWHPLCKSLKRLEGSEEPFSPSLISSGQYMTIAERFADDPIKARLPESVIDRWLDNICDNIAFIYLSTYSFRVLKKNILNQKYISDYAPQKMFKIMLELRPNSSVEEKFLLIDRILNVTHPRGELASLFIEGGKTALSEISGTNEPKKEKPKCHIRTNRLNRSKNRKV